MSQSLRANLHMDKRVTLEYSTVFLLAKNIAYWKNERKILFQNLLFLNNMNIMNCGVMNCGCVTAAVLGVRNYVLLETRLREFNRIADGAGGVGL